MQLEKIHKGGCTDVVRADVQVELVCWEARHLVQRLSNNLAVQEHLVADSFAGNLLQHFLQDELEADILVGLDSVPLNNRALFEQWSQMLRACASVCFHRDRAVKWVGCDQRWGCIRT